MEAVERQKIQWSQLLEQAVTVPGAIEQSFRQFHGYSFGNRIAAFCQCLQRGIQPGPIATFPKWIELGRHVKKGEKAIWLCQPITVKARGSKDDASQELENDTPADGGAVRTVFTWKPKWFTLAQTDGAEYVAPASIGTWNREAAMIALEVQEVPFAMMDGNVQGYAKRRELAINPVAQNVEATLFHELAHIVLGHTAKGDEAAAHGADLPRNIREVEAEAVALLCLETLQLPGGDFCRGYIQNWYKSNQPIPETSAARIFGAADQILRAGGAL